MNSDDRILILGATGLVGSALLTYLSENKYRNFQGIDSEHLDLCDRAKVFETIHNIKPGIVIIAAGKVGGILENSTFPADFYSENIQMQTNVLDACRDAMTPTVVYFGSACMYPKGAPQPILEDKLLTGSFEESNEGYAAAKIAGYFHVRSLRKQFGLNYFTVIPTNVYGENDNFDENSGHVIPALIRKFHNARVQNVKKLELWGSGRPIREFLNARDLAAAVIFLIGRYDSELPINIGSGQNISIQQLAVMISHVVGYEGQILWNEDQPDGVAIKSLDSTKISILGWKANIQLQNGIEEAYNWYKQSHWLRG